jgi:hypothetical protein
MALVFIRLNLVLERLFIRDSQIKASPRENAQLEFGYVQPTAVLGAMKHNLFKNPARGCEGLVNRGRLVRVGVREIRITSACG